MSKTFKADGEKHTVKKNKKGEVIVDHAGNKGKYDKINLTKRLGLKQLNKVLPPQKNGTELKVSNGCR